MKVFRCDYCGDLTDTTMFEVCSDCVITLPPSDRSMQNKSVYCDSCHKWIDVQYKGSSRIMNEIIDYYLNLHECGTIDLRVAKKVKK